MFGSTAILTAKCDKGRKSFVYNNYANGYVCGKQTIASLN